MARSAAQKRAFRKMIAALHRKRRKNPKRSRARRRRRPSVVVVRTNPHRGGKHMARRHRRRRRGMTAIMVNPRRRHHKRRRNFSRRRNPDGFLGELMVAGLPAVIGGGALAYADGAFLADKSGIVRVGIKVVLAGVLGLALRRRHPLAAVAAVATVITAAVTTEVTRMLATANGKAIAAGTAVPAGAPLLAAGGATPAMKALVREDGRAMGVLVEMPRMGAMRLDNNVSLGSNEIGSTALPAGTSFQDVSLGTG